MTPFNYYSFSDISRHYNSLPTEYSPYDPADLERKLQTHLLRRDPQQALDLLQQHKSFNGRECGDMVSLLTLALDIVSDVDVNVELWCAFINEVLDRNTILHLLFFKDVYNRFRQRVGSGNVDPRYAVMERLKALVSESGMHEDAPQVKKPIFFVGKKRHRGQNNNPSTALAELQVLNKNLVKEIASYLDVTEHKTFTNVCRKTRTASRVPDVEKLESFLSSMHHIKVDDVLNLFELSPDTIRKGVHATRHEALRNSDDTMKAGYLNTLIDKLRSARALPVKRESEVFKEIYRYMRETISVNASVTVYNSLLQSSDFRENPNLSKLRLDMMTDLEALPPELRRPMLPALIKYSADMLDAETSGKRRALHKTDGDQTTCNHERHEKAQELCNVYLSEIRDIPQHVTPRLKMACLLNLAKLYYGRPFFADKELRVDPVADGKFFQAFFKEMESLPEEYRLPAQRLIAAQNFRFCYGYDETTQFPDELQKKALGSVEDLPRSVVKCALIKIAQSWNDDARFNKAIATFDKMLADSACLLPNDVAEVIGATDIGLNYQGEKAVDLQSHILKRSLEIDDPVARRHVLKRLVDEIQMVVKKAKRARRHSLYAAIDKLLPVQKEELFGLLTRELCIDEERLKKEFHR
jgi:hypothetical protein